MRVVPSVIAESTVSSAEREVFRLLSEIELHEGTTAFHSVNLSKHEYKVSGEIDFILLSREALLVLEVKGGSVACGPDGRWIYTNRYGQAFRRSEGPFEQAASAMHSLRTELGQALDISPLRIGFGVVVPDVVFDVSSVSWDKEIVVDARDFAAGAKSFRLALLRLFAHWRKKLGSKGRASEELVDKVSLILRPQFELLPSLGARAGQSDRHMEILTEAQFKLLDAADANARIVCTGGAGTGKTFLLVELAKRAARLGNRVLVTCQSEVLLRYIEARLPTSVDSLPFGELDAQIESPVWTPYDLLLVDEGQDILSLENLLVLDRAVHDGLEDGRWRIFMDENAQASLFGVFESAALDLLRGCGVSIRLPENCRNTTEIGLQTRLLTGADIGQPIVGGGVPVTYKYYRTSHEQLELISTTMASLLDDGVKPRDITMLSPLCFERSVVSGLDRQYLPLDIMTIDPGKFPPNRITFSTISGFKGLENQFVLLTNIDDAPSNARDVAELYVALTRARFGLYVFIARAARSGFELMTRENLRLTLDMPMEAE